MSASHANTIIEKWVNIGAVFWATVYGQIRISPISWCQVQTLFIHKKCEILIYNNLWNLRHVKKKFHKCREFDQYSVIQSLKKKGSSLICFTGAWGAWLGKKKTQFLISIQHPIITSNKFWSWFEQCSNFLVFDEEKWDDIILDVVLYVDNLSNWCFFLKKAYPDENAPLQTQTWCLKSR